MVRSCFHVGCTSGYNIKKYGSSHVFKIPAGASDEQRRLWTQNIPKQVNKVFDFKADTICYLHFEEEYIIKEHYIFSNGEKLPQGPRKRWKLREDAVPTKFSNSKVSSIYDRRCLKRKAPAVRDSSVKPKNTKLLNAGPEDRDSEDAFNIQNYSTDTYPLALLKGGIKIDFPVNWQLDLKDSADGILATLFELGDVTANYFIDMKKFVQIFQNNTKTEITTVINGRKFSEFDNYAINNVDHVSSLIHQVNSMAFCCGIPNYGNISECKTGIKRGQIWYSSKCEVQVQDQQVKCQCCLRLGATLRMRLSRLKLELSVKHRFKFTPALPTQAMAYVKSLRRRITHKTHQLRRCQRRSALSRLTINVLKKKMENTDTVTLLESIKKSDLPDNMKESFRNAIRNAKRKSANGNRYESGWLLQCLLLKIKSPKAYRHLRSNNVLPLPHPSTLQRLIAGIPCEFGFTEFIFEQMQKDFAGKSSKQREGILMFDEIKVREEVSYDKIKMQFNGFVDCGDGKPESHSSQSKLADHALVFMFKSHYSNTIQPLGSFATKGAASGATLAKLLISCVIRLETANARISAVVSDGATTNKNMWKLLGVSGSLTQFSNKIDHPCQVDAQDGQTRPLYFISDVPHLMKCIRNHFFKYRLVSFNGNLINANFYQAVYDLDKDLTKGLRIIPKITEAHLKPNAFQKMRVYLATQVFSKSMADGIRFHRERNEIFLKGSESTEHFTRTINDLFDALNACHTSVGVRWNSREHKTIEEFKTQIFDKNYVPTFCSSVTLESLRVTVQSFLDLIKYLIQNAGFKYVLTGKINQDSLERFFGILRQVAGDEDHPTVISFMHLYRLLCLYTPTAKLIHGNVRSGEDEQVAMSQYVDVLLRNRKASATESRSKRLAIDDKILKSIVSDNPTIDCINEDHILDHNYCKTEASACVVYQLCGYIAHRVKIGKQFTTCTDCKSSVSSYDESLNVEARLTKIKSLGALQYPSNEYYHLINDHVEPKIAEKLTGLHVDLVSDIVDSISTIPCFAVGCGKESHKENLIRNYHNPYQNETTEKIV